MTAKTNIQAIAAASQALASCIASKRPSMVIDAWESHIARIMETAPNGSGFDCGTKLVGADSKSAVFKTDFHKMDDNGGYDGWVNNILIVVKPAFDGFDLDVMFSDESEVADYPALEDYIADVFYTWLASPCASIFTIGKTEE